MRLTTDIIWDYLFPVDKDAKVYNCIKRKAEFSSVRQHPNKEHVFVENAIYVVDYEKYDVINSQQERFAKNTFIFVSDKDEKSFDPASCTVSAFVIMNESIMDIFTQVSDIAVDFNNWAEEINDALIRNVPLKELVNIGLKYIINPFIILDEALNLVSFTDNIHEDDQTFRETIEKGYTPPRLISAIMEKRGAKKKDFTSYEVYSGETAMTPYEEINAPILVDGKIKAVLYVHCTEVKPSDGARDVINYFAEKLAFYFARNSIESVRIPPDNAKIAQFLGYLLRHDLDDQEVALMAEAAEFPFKARFKLYVLEPGIGDTGLQYTLNRATEVLIQEKCFIFENVVVVLSAYIWKNTSEEEHIEILEKQLKKLMADNGCYCGASRNFTDLARMKDACIQARASVRLGRKLSGERKGVNAFDWRPEIRNQIFRYDDFAIHHMLESCSRQMPLRLMCFPPVIEMLRYDEVKGTDNYKILYTYLENDRVTSEAATLLHMHRNNVNYRIKRIEEMFGLNLSDNDERLRIQMTFRILDLYEDI